VFGYLSRLRVLSEEGGGAGGRGAAAGSGGSSEDEEGGPGGAPCELCGRTFPHEHVRAMYRGGEEDGGGDSSDWSDGGGA
jgi:hypothetical protein